MSKSFSLQSYGLIKRDYIYKVPGNNWRLQTLLRFHKYLTSRGYCVADSHVDLSLTGSPFQRLSLVPTESGSLVPSLNPSPVSPSRLSLTKYHPMENWKAPRASNHLLLSAQNSLLASSNLFSVLQPEKSLHQKSGPVPLQASNTSRAFPGLRVTPLRPTGPVCPVLHSSASHHTPVSAALYPSLLQDPSFAMDPLIRALCTRSGPSAEEPSSYLGLVTPTYSPISAQSSISQEAFPDHTVYQIQDCPLSAGIPPKTPVDA